MSFVNNFCVVGRERSTSTTEFSRFICAYVMQKWLPQRGLHMAMPGGGVCKRGDTGYTGWCDDPHIDCAAWMITSNASRGWMRYLEVVHPHTLVVGERIVGLDIAANSGASGTTGP